MDKPLSPAAVFAVLKTIRLHEWGRRATVLAYLGEALCCPEPGPVDIRHRVLAENTGLTRGSIAELLTGLVADRVLECYPGDGPQVRLYRPNPNIRQWLGVPWRLDVEKVVQRVTVANDETPELTIVRGPGRGRPAKPTTWRGRSVPGETDHVEGAVGSW